MGEFDLIAHIRVRAAAQLDASDQGMLGEVVRGIGDDAALLRVPPGHTLVVSTDTLNAGVHFPPHTAPADVGWKALAVNLSDLAAMGATPAWCTLSLSLPRADDAWLQGFLDGFFALAERHRVALVGGDTTRGPLSIAVTVHGLVPDGAALLRSGARAGDEVWVTGTLGDAAAGLALAAPDPTEPDPIEHDSQALPSGAGDTSTRLEHARAGVDALLLRLNRPTPRLAAGIALRGLASACIDVSDGLLADLRHVLVASGVGAELEIARLPSSAALTAHCIDTACDDDARWALQSGGGDDYELCFTAAAGAHAAIVAALATTQTPACVIGRIVAGAPTLRVRAPDGRDWLPSRDGYRHFDADA